MSENARSPTGDPFLDEIREKLETIDRNVFYAKADNQTLEVWDYIVFARENIRRTDTRNGMSEYIRVVIVREDFVPRATIVDCIKVMQEIPGVRLAQEQIEFDYIDKPGTGDTLEMAFIPFVRPWKMCDYGG